jgi:hypothetical protein
LLEMGTRGEGGRMAAAWAAAGPHGRVVVAQRDSTAGAVARRAVERAGGAADSRDGQTCTHGCLSW